MSNTREFRKNPTHGLKMYSQFFLPMKNFLEGQIAKLNLTVDIDNISAISLYKKIGFQECKKENKYYLMVYKNKNKKDG